MGITLVNYFNFFLPWVVGLFFDNFGVSCVTFCVIVCHCEMVCCNRCRNYVTQMEGAWRERNCFCIVKFAGKVRPYACENTTFVTELCTQNKVCFASVFLELVAKAEGNFHCNYCSKMSRNKFALCSTRYKMKGLVHFVMIIYWISFWVSNSNCVFYEFMV